MDAHHTVLRWYERKCSPVNTSWWWRQLSIACVLSAAETVRAMTHVINQGMAMYWGTSRWSPMEIMVRLSAISYSHWLLIIRLYVCGSLMPRPVFRKPTRWRDSSTRFLPSVSRLSTTCFREKVEVQLPELFHKIGALAHSRFCQITWSTFKCLTDNFSHQFSKRLLPSVLRCRGHDVVTTGLWDHLREIWWPGSPLLPGLSEGR